MPTESEMLRQVMRFWATGVTIVTAAYEGIQHGMTVSSFTSISLDPPQVLISLSQDSRTHDLITHSRNFGITILNSSQQDISDRFAGRVPDDMDRLEGLKTITLATGTPLLKQGLAHLDCHVVTTVGSGTHTIFIAEVVSARFGEDGDPLLYFNRSYQNLQKS